MSGVYIKDMEMPKNCRECRLMTADYGCVIVGAVGYALTEGRRCKDCPLVPVPPHGRLIDADVLKVYMLNEHYNYREVVSYSDIVVAPTVIEGEDE